SSFVTQNRNCSLGLSGIEFVTCALMLCSQRVSPCAFCCRSLSTISKTLRSRNRIRFTSFPCERQKTGSPCHSSVHPLYRRCLQARCRAWSFSPHTASFLGARADAYMPAVAVACGMDYCGRISSLLRPQDDRACQYCSGALVEKPCEYSEPPPIGVTAKPA